MDFIVRLFRALANTTRLAILRYVVRNPEATVSAIAAELGLGLPDVSRAMKLLSDHGVVDRRPAGTFVLTRLGKAEDARHVVLKQVRRLLARVFGADDPGSAGELVCPEQKEVTWQGVYDAMCFDFTAYTHLRRLMLLRYVDGRRDSSLVEIGREIGMSKMAVWRHTDKLLRRGILRETRRGRSGLVAIERTPDTWLRTELRKCVLAALRGEANYRTCESPLICFGHQEAG